MADRALHLPPPRTDEDATSVAPALRLLVAMGWKYISPAEALALRGGRRSEVLLYGMLEHWLREHNRIEYRGSVEPFSEGNIAAAVAALRDEPDDGLVRTNERLYDLLVLGKAMKQSVRGDTKSFQLRYVDWVNPANNLFHVTEEFAVERTGMKETYRPDLVLFVNGIPFGVIECKRADLGPNAKAPVMQAISQQIRNQKEDGIPKLYRYAQVLGAVSAAGVPADIDESSEYAFEARMPARYATVGTPLRFWAHWREAPRGAEETTIADTTIRAWLDPTGARADDSGLPGDARIAARLTAGHTGTATAERDITAQDRLLAGVFSPDRLLLLAHRYMVFDGGVKKIARYQQFFCVEKLLRRIRRIDQTGTRRGGVVWHTQGSGKSLTMVMLAKAIAHGLAHSEASHATPNGRLEMGRNPRIVLVTDRVDLDEQIYRTFSHCGLTVTQARTGAELVQLLRDTSAKIITTVINKFEAAMGKERVTIDDPDIFVLVDEGHRTQFGIRHAAMRRVLPNACYIGFTGTPVSKAEQSTVSKFGGMVDTYTLAEAESDRSVLPLVYEGRHVEKDIRQDEIDDWFETYTASLPPERRSELQARVSTKSQVMQADQVIRRIARDISDHYAQFLKGTGLKGQLVAPSKRAALRYKHWLDDLGRVRSEVLISAPDDRESEEDIYAPNQDAVIRFWKSTMERHGTEAAYNKAVISAFKDGDTTDPESDDPEIIIVVDKLLTGFDAPQNTVLYLTRSLRDHGLLQAIARVNRLAPGKERGVILDYYGVLEHLDEALATYARSPDDPAADELGFVEGVANIESAWRDLAERHHALWDTFKELGNSRDREAFERHLADEARRLRFYERFTAFARTLDLALASARFLEETPEPAVRRYRADLKFFAELRRSARIRYAEVVDFSEYEPKIRRLLDEYIAAHGVDSITGQIDLTDQGQRAAALAAAGSETSKAETIASNVERVLNGRIRHEDPALYRRLSARLQEVIEQMRAGWLAAAAAVARVEEIEVEVVRPTGMDVPEALRDSRIAPVLYRNLHETLGERTASASQTMSEILEEMASHVNWHDDIDRQKRAQQELDDFLFDLNEREGMGLSIETIDAVIANALERARAIL